jgi:hypothetical protein
VTGAGVLPVSDARADLLQALLRMARAPEFPVVQDVLLRRSSIRALQYGIDFRAG